MVPECRNRTFFHGLRSPRLKEDGLATTELDGKAKSSKFPALGGICRVVRKGEGKMHKKLVIIMAAFCVLALAGTVMAGLPLGTKWVITYDGYICQDLSSETKTITADTLIVVTNSHPTWTMNVLLDFFDKDGTKINTSPVGLLAGTPPLLRDEVPTDGYGWITLSYVLNRDSIDPTGVHGYGEKLSFRVYTSPGKIPPVVEVKQVIYKNPIEYEVLGDPRHLFVWFPAYIQTWAETALGGLTGTGLVYKK